MESNYDFKGKKMLLAEDDRDSIKLVQEMLKDTGIEILLAKTGLEALYIASENKDLNLILMDIRMPGMDGYQSTKKIREFNKKIPIIAYTGYVEDGVKEKILNSEFNDYLPKPVSKATLLSTLNDYLIRR